MKKLLIIVLFCLIGCPTKRTDQEIANDELSGRIRAFWQYVSENESSLSSANRSNMAIYGEIEEQAQLINENFRIFISDDYHDGKRQLILSCGGNPEYFDLCDRVVAAAPKFDRFIPVSLFPPNDSFDIFAIGGQVLNPEDVRVHFEADDEEMELLFLLSANHLENLQSDSTGILYSYYMQALFNMTFQILGERIMGTRIKGAEINPLFVIMPSVPFRELGNYIH